MEWNAAYIEKLIAPLRKSGGDSSTIEVKRAEGGIPSSINRTICAFANMPSGGTVLFGIDEKSDFTIVGVRNPAELARGITDIARESVQPAVTIISHIVEIEGRFVVAAEVIPLRVSDRPAQTQGLAYLRQADGDYVIAEHELRMIESDKLQINTPSNFDKFPATGLTIDDLVDDLVDDYLDAARASDKRLRASSDEEILRRTGVTLASGDLTVAGLYAMGDYPQGEYPALTVTAAVQVTPNSQGVRNRNLTDFTGPIPVLLAEILHWIRENLDRVNRYRSDGHMEEQSELPMAAIRELVANALVHRDLGPHTLGTGKSIQIRIDEKKLMILSPGGLRGVSLDQIESDDHAQAAVNQRLYAIAKKLNTSDGASIIEGEGGGIHEVFSLAERYHLERPKLIDTGVQFKALLWRPNHAGGPLPYVETPSAATPELPAHTGGQIIGTTVNEQAVLALLRNSDLTIHELSEGAGLTIGQVRYALRAPLSRGTVQMIGGQGRRSTRYHLNL